MSGIVKHTQLGNGQGKELLLRFFPQLLFLLNILLRLPTATHQPLSLDEPFSVYHAQFSLTDLIRNLKPYNNPPLFEIILHFWIRLFGLDILHLRMLPVLLASLCPPFLFILAKRLFDVRIGILSSLMLTFSSLLMFYAHDCRAYSLFLLLTLLSTIAFNTHDLKKKINWPYVLSGTLLIYTHYFGFIVLFIHGVSVLGRRSQIQQMIFSLAAIALLYIPQLLVMANRLSDSVSNGTWVQAPDGVNDLYNMLWSFSNAPVITVFSIALLVLSFFLVLKSGEKNLQFTQLWFFSAYFGMFLISYRVPMYLSRYLIFILPAFYMLLSTVIWRLFSYRIALVLSGLLFLAFVFTCDYYPDKKRPVDDIAAALKPYKEDSSAAVIITPVFLMPEIAYYLSGEAFTSGLKEAPYAAMDSILKTNDIYHIEYPGDIDSRILNFPRLKLLAFSEGRATVFSSRLLESGYFRENSQQFRQNWYIISFVRNPEP